MKKSFIEKVIRENIVDTRSYRYHAVCLPDRLEIRRLPIVSLDTTDAINGWETVLTIK